MARRKKKKRIGRLLFVLFIELMVVGFLFFKFGILGKINRNASDDEKIVQNKEIKKAKGYQNIVVFGVDSRQRNHLDRGNSDAIIIVSINNKTNDVKLASIYRDNYSKIADAEGKFTKINAAYAKGGYALALSTINKNFDLNITEYVTVDFNAVIDVVDSIGGLTLDIKQEELKWLNVYIRELNRLNHTKVPQIWKPGRYKVNGTQALAWARIRHAPGDDFMRTQRQRTVIKKIFNKVKTLDAIKITSLYNKMAPQISTNLSDLEMAGLAKDVMAYNIVGQTGFPYEKDAHNYRGVSYVFTINLADNVTRLHAFLFNKKNYVPSSTVQEYSGYIESIRKQK
jgi:LCP family protein required for cell wall assembly